MENETAKIIKNSLIKGILISVVLFWIAMGIHTLVLALWYNGYEGELTQAHSVPLTTLGGVFPVFAHIMLGIVRSLKTLQTDLYFKLLKPQIINSITTSIEKQKDKIGTPENSVNDFREKIFNMIWETVEKSFSHLPHWIKKSIIWIMNKASLHAALLYFAKTAQNLSPQQLSSKLDDIFVKVIDNAKPFWISWLLPLHIGLLIAIWFI